MKQSTLGDFSTTGDILDEFPCPYDGCLRSFDTRIGLKAHHRQIHDEKLDYTIALPCDNCGDEIRREEDKLYNTNFCDADCMYAYQSGSNHHNATGKDVPCSWCGEQLYRSSNQRGEWGHFCDHECYGAWLSENHRGENHHQYTREPVDCFICNKTIYRRLSYFDGRTHLCSPECRAVWLQEEFIGTNHPNWRGGGRLAEKLRRCLGPSSWRRISLRTIEGAECAGIGCKKTRETNRIDAHHIIPIIAGGSNDDELLMPLCQSCHRSAEYYTSHIVTPVIADIVADEME